MMTLDSVRNRPHSFVWGKVRKIHDIGPHIAIVEFNVREEERITDEVAFHIFFNGNDLSRSASTLEGACILAFGIGKLGKHEGTTMAIAAAKLLGFSEPNG